MDVHPHGRISGKIHVDGFAEDRLRNLDFLRCGAGQRAFKQQFKKTIDLRRFSEHATFLNAFPVSNEPPCVFVL
ncbi:hypothetical protein WT24_15010 [Burkholderia sp. MSMB1078WGS]|nr:hypothetical protein WT24_15010 [Burkholderia sp. MSMB1078WGS]